MSDTEKRASVMVRFTDGVIDFNEEVVRLKTEDGLLRVWRTDGEERIYILHNIQFFTINPQTN